MGARAGVTFGDPGKAGPYAEALRKAGVEPVLICAGGPMPAVSLDGLLITGGTDIDPRRYGEEPHANSHAPDVARDELEDRLLREALEADLPVLAICRGVQLLNVVEGGSLIQHIEGHRRPGLPDAHPVEVIAGTKLAQILGQGQHSVNSRHHQTIGRVGQRLTVSARSADGIIEALERPRRRFVIGVQWHPEDRVETSPKDRELFEAFARALRGK